MKRASRVAGAIAHMVVFGLCLEMAARADDWLTHGAPFWGRYDAEQLRGLDDDGVPRNVPGARFEKWRINSLGFRGDETPQRKPAGRRRIVCLGQSETFGLYESPGNEWPAQLGRMLASRHPEVEVINASVAGTGRRTRQAYIDKYLVPLQPDAILLYFNPYNEATEALRGTPADPGGAISRTGKGPAAPPPGPQLRMLAKLRLRAMQALPPRLVGEFRGWQLRRRLRALEAGVLGGAAPLPVLPAEAVASFEVHVAEIVARLRSQGVEPVLLTYPTLVHEDNRAALEDVLSGERTFRIWLSDEALLDAARQLNDATRRVAMRTETSLVDVDASLGRTVEEFADQVHYTDRGARRVAEIVRDALEGLGMPFPQGGGPASRAAP